MPPWPIAEQRRECHKSGPYYIAPHEGTVQFDGHDLTNQLNKKNENEFFKWINILDDIASNKGTGSFYHFINLIYTNLYFGNKNINQIFGKNTFNYYWDNEYKSLFLWFGKDYLKIINKVEFY